LFDDAGVKPASTSPSSIFGIRLREARLRAGVSQEKLGALIGLDEGCSSARMSRYESGQHQPPYNIAFHIAAALNIPVPYLYCDNDVLAELLLATSGMDAACLNSLKQYAIQLSAK